jgi:hypothetical protein
MGIPAPHAKPSATPFTVQHAHSSTQHPSQHPGPRPTQAPSHRESVDEALQRIQMGLANMNAKDKNTAMAPAPSQSKTGRPAVHSIPLREAEPVTSMGALGKKVQPPTWLPTHGTAPHS